YRRYKGGYKSYRFLYKDEKTASKMSIRTKRLKNSINFVHYSALSHLIKTLIPIHLLTVFYNDYLYITG
ncbi:MAG: hypothetical protein WBK94_00850, partial [Tenuifilaceae bacterium]|nr:hypothetical protein [Bacteroidales bacterium]MDI9515832.1 hypothetical protein [Bacteroidota bacterium]